MRSNENKFDGVKRRSQRESNSIGIYPVGFTFAVKTKRRHDRNNTLSQQGFEELHIHPFHFARELMIHTLNDSQRMRDHGICRNSPKVVGGKALQNFMGEAIPRTESQPQRL